MVVVDEQHRFGVEQRDRLRAKAPDGLTPHLLVMTATPIPRTVALTVYGDLETSTLRELPRGRQPITTNTIFLNEKPAWLERAWQRIIEEVGAGRQAYVVASRIDEDDKAADEKDGKKTGGPPATTVVDLFERLGHGPLAGLRLGLMHGRLSADEKDAVMAAFRAAEIDVLVCTTVIEVGVDVPNATVMVVMDADRFGISQLHQLRGRIGRGSIRACACSSRNYRRHRRRAIGSRRSRRRSTASNSQTSIWRNARGRCAGAQPVRPSHHTAFAVAVGAPRDHRPRARSAKSLYEGDPSRSRNGRRWQRRSATPTASSTWTSHEPQTPAVVGRDRRPRGAGRRSGHRRRRGTGPSSSPSADVPTVAPGVDVLAGIAVVPVRIRGHDYRTRCVRRHLDR